MNNYYKVPSNLTSSILAKIAKCEQKARLDHFYEIGPIIISGTPFPEGVFEDDAHAEYEALCYMFGRLPSDEDIKRIDELLKRKDHED